MATDEVVRFAPVDPLYGDVDDDGVPDVAVGRLPVPDTWMVPPKEYEHADDLQVTLERYAQPFDLADVGEAIGYPAFLKPYSGGGWVGVSKADNVFSTSSAE